VGLFSALREKTPLMSCEVHKMNIKHDANINWRY